MASQNTSSLISQVYKSRSVILELLQKQNYVVSEYDGFSVNEINTMKTNNQLDMILEKVIEKASSEGEEKRSNKVYIKY